MKKCIYCNTEKNLNISHIVPESLTNSNISRQNVCTERHNNHFGDSFEKEVILKLSYLRNYLGIKNKKNKHIPYDAIVEIEGIEYEKGILNALDFFDGRLSKSKDNEYLFGDFEDVKAIADKKGKEVQKIDLNEQKPELKIPLNIEVFFSLDMRRLAAKMAFEWLCSFNEINEKFDEFSSIIGFIETGEDDQYVTYVTAPAIYNSFSEFTESASHSFLAFEDANGKLQVLINFFGVCIFSVHFSGNIPPQIRNKFGFLELQVTTKKIEYAAKDFPAFISGIEDNVVYVGNEFMMIPYHPSISDIDFRYGTAIIKFVKEFKRTTGTPTVDENLVNIVVGNLNTLFSTSILHIRMLKRFAAEQIPDSSESITVNLRDSSGEVFFSYYVLFLIGQKGEAPESHSHINSIISETFGEGETIFLNNDITDKLKIDLLSNPSHSKNIMLGAKLIEEAPHHRF